ncbi:unnamed protein product [Adineta ricciae]|uniref:Methyltransferase-like protein 22 n=1 Tax=Adineta ricciae TaxID=249248 RepID=A0A815BHL8_ADIRI|nr:unnamed protein product [Adineta ricciae]
MYEEQTDPYLIHSDVFPSTEDKLAKDTLQFRLVSKNDNDSIEFDDDGDLVTNRPERLDIILVHRNETNIAQCGYQLWNGCLLLCDYLLTNSNLFQNRIVLELGAGVGLCTILASRFVAKVISTDYDSDILEMIRENVRLNEDICRRERIQIEKLNWKQYDCDAIDNEIEIIIAADGIY